MPRFIRAHAVLTLLAIGTALPANAQQCYLQQDCPAGTLCGPEGSCRDVRSVLGATGGTIFWVDKSAGNDSNPGTEALPWKTIQRAAGANVMSPGDAVLVRAGTYFGAIEPKAAGTPGRRITYAAYPGDNVIVSGATPLDLNWSADGAAYKATWPHGSLWTRRVNEGHERDDDARRRDMVIADGQVLTPVYTRADVVPGTFFLQGSPDNPNTLFVHLDGGKNPANATMQASITNTLFNPSNTSTYCHTGNNIRGYYHLIGFTFRHTANEGQNGAVCAGSAGSLIENVTVEWTNGAGFLISGDNHVVRGVTARYNGMSGIRGERCHQCLIEFATISENNWKNYSPFWESGGGKWLYTTESTFRHIYSYDNNGPGLWLDMDNFDNVVENSRFDSNYGVNLFIEFASNRNVIRNNVMTRARYARPAFYGYGLLLHAVDDNVVLHNTMMANEGGGMRIRADFRGPALRNRYYNNLFIANGVMLGGDHKASELSFEEHANITQARTNKGEGNVFWDRAYATQEYNTFQLRSKDLSGSNVLRSSTLAEWQNKAQTDYTSSVLDLSKPHVQDTTDHWGGWHLAENAQVIGKAVVLPSDVPAVLYDFYGNPRPTSNPDVGAHQYDGDSAPPPPAFVVGDASGNGIVTALDASLILRHASGLADLETQPGADASGDGIVTAYDAALVLQYITGYLACFPGDHTCSDEGAF